MMFFHNQTIQSEKTISLCLMTGSVLTHFFFTCDKLLQLDDCQMFQQSGPQGGASHHFSNGNQFIATDCGIQKSNKHLKASGTGILI